jgi:hypothetical protein
MGAGMTRLYDWTWSIEERAERQYNQFMIFGSKGMVLAYPTVRPPLTASFYTRDEAALNATVAAHAPEMLRALENLAIEMNLLADEDVLVNSWRETVLAVVAIAKGEVVRADEHA